MTTVDVERILILGVPAPAEDDALRAAIGAEVARALAPPAATTTNHATVARTVATAVQRAVARGTR